MSNFRCKPGNLVMSEAVSFGQKWTYHSTDPMEEMIQSRYFISKMDQIRMGDEIRLVRIEENRVAEIAEVIVTASDWKTKTFQFHMLRKPEKMREAVEGETSTTRNLTVKRGFQCCEIIDEHENFIARRRTKVECEELIPKLEKLSDLGLSDFMNQEAEKEAKKEEQQAA